MQVNENYYKYMHESSPRLVLRFFDIHSLKNKEREISEVVDLETFGEYIVEDVVLKQPYSFMASDQKGPNIILSFSQQCSHCISQQFVNISLENKDRVLETICKYDRLSIPRLVLVC